MNIRRITVVIVAIALFSAICAAGERSAGKYSGVVIFDRWGGCTLYSGIYVMYVSESVKEQLRAETDKCVQIDATQVEQPQNPGDGLIKKFTLLGPAPAAKELESPDGMKIAAAPAFDDGQAPACVIRAENISDKPVTLRMGSLAPTLLAAQTKGANRWSPSDGPSIAVVTRQSFWVGMDGPRMKGANETWQWEVTAPRSLKKDVVLQPKTGFELYLLFKLPAGEYEFLAGYGGGVHDGQCIASNLIAFDVKPDGTATLAKAAGR